MKVLREPPPCMDQNVVDLLFHPALHVLENQLSLPEGLEITYHLVTNWVKLAYWIAKY